MADLNREYAAKIAKSSLSAESVNKLIKAYTDDKISSDDLLHISEYTDFTNKCDKYVDDFLKSIDNGVYHETAAKILTAVNFGELSYRDAAAYVKTGAFYPTNYAGLSVTNDIARELNDMKVPLRGCQGFNGGYTIENIEWTIKTGDAVFVHDKDLAVRVGELMKNPDWVSFRDYVRDNADTENLTGKKLSNMYDEYVSRDYRTALYNKVEQEYSEYISDLMNEIPEIIIQSAYEIVWKNNIKTFCEEYSPDLTDKQYAALLSSRNTLDEIYEQWCQNGELFRVDDIQVTLEETADRIQISLDRDKKDREQKAQKTEAAPEAKPEQTQQAVKPKHKSR